MENLVSFPLKGFITRCRHVGNSNLKQRSVGSLISSSLINLNDLSQLSLQINPQTNELAAHVIKQALDSIQAQFCAKFKATNGDFIKIYWVQNHSTLVEYTNEAIDSKLKALIGLNSNTDGLATFMVDVSMFMSNTEGLIKQDLVSVLYEMGFARAFVAFLKFSNKEAFEIALNVGGRRLELAEYLETSSNLIHLGKWNFFIFKKF